MSEMGESRLVVVPDYEALSRKAAERVVETVRADPEAAISLATGSTPRGMFAELIGRVRRGEVDLSRVHLFCLDEYSASRRTTPTA